jgi:hypothetical protein
MFLSTSEEHLMPLACIRNVPGSYIGGSGYTNCLFRLFSLAFKQMPGDYREISRLASSFFAAHFA